MTPWAEQPALSMSIAAQLENVALVSVAVKAIMEHSGLPGQDADSFELALVEAMNNVIEHGYAYDAAQQLRVDLSIGADEFVCDIVDHGHRLPEAIIRTLRDRAACLPSPQALAESGYGLALMSAYADDLIYRNTDGANMLRLVKKRPGKR